MSVHLTIAGRSDVGRSRSNNEDALVIADVASGALFRGNAPTARLQVGDSGVLLAVSDGMGGEKAGEVASAVVVETVARALMGTRRDAPPDARIEDAVQEANREVLRAARQPGREGMGATLTAVYVQKRDSGATAFIAEVGDSRAYLLRAGQITRLTKDQSYVQLLLDAGTLDEHEAADSPLHSVILQAMGHRGRIDVALAKLELRRRDCLLLCSDGLSNPVKDDEIRNTVLHSADLEQACAKLVRLANDRGGPDNITVLTAGVGGDLEPPREHVGETLEVLASFEPKSLH